MAKALQQQEKRHMRSDGVMDSTVVQISGMVCGYANLYVLVVFAHPPKFMTNSIIGGKTKFSGSSHLEIICMHA